MIMILEIIVPLESKRRMEYTVLWVTALFRVAKALLYFIMFLSFQLNHKPLPHFQKTLEHIMEKKRKNSCTQFLFITKHRKHTT